MICPDHFKVFATLSILEMKNCEAKLQVCINYHAHSCIFNFFVFE